MTYLVWNGKGWREIQGKKVIVVLASAANGGHIVREIQFVKTVHAAEPERPVPESVPGYP